MKYLVRQDLSIAGKSPPSRGRGLKLVNLKGAGSHDIVAPLAGAWIEILCTERRALCLPCRPPRGGVD